MQVEGGRLGITGNRMEGNRVFGGAIQVSRNEDGKVATTLSKTPQKDNVDTLELPMGSFDDGVKTNGSFRWVRLDERRWRLIPVPGSMPFRVEGSQKALAGLNDSKMGCRGGGHRGGCRLAGDERLMQYIP